MATVLRIKRKLQDEPLEAVILNCKRLKLNENDTNNLSEIPELSSTILTLAGTIQETENVLTHLKKQNLDDIKGSFKNHTINLKRKLRNEHQENSKNSRYKIVNCLRSNNTEEVEDQSSVSTSLGQSNITILDVEPDLQGKDSKENETEKYVYDLYYTSSDHFGDNELENQEYVSIYPLKDPLFFSPSEDQLDSDLDSEDSNAENNWRNDYPDEDDMLSVNEDDMVEAMKNVGLDDLLSSDDGEEGFVYSIDSEAAGFEEDIDESDVHRYGERYARFKARNKKDLETSSRAHDLYYGDIDGDEADDSYEYY